MISDSLFRGQIVWSTDSSRLILALHCCKEPCCRAFGRFTGDKVLDLPVDLQLHSDHPLHQQVLPGVNFLALFDRKRLTAQLVNLQSGHVGKIVTDFDCSADMLQLNHYAALKLGCWHPFEPLVIRVQTEAGENMGVGSATVTLHDVLQRRFKWQKHLTGPWEDIVLECWSPDGDIILMQANKWKWGTSCLILDAADGSVVAELAGFDAVQFSPNAQR